MIKVDTHADPDTPQILADDALPVLNPVQDFCDDLALVTVSLRERTSDNRINVHPYLVTNTRELIRLGDQQILTLGGREVALRDLPYGGEFLMRWRYSDMQHFLSRRDSASGRTLYHAEELANDLYRFPIRQR